MKKYIICLLACAVLWSCDKQTDLSINGSKVSFFVNDWEFETGTRVAVSITSNGANFKWTVGDTIGVFPSNGYPTAFPISSGENTASANFDGADWALRPSASYAGYYPFSIKNLDKEAIPISYFGQTQNGNNSTAHLGAYDFLSSEYTTVSDEGTANFIMNHLGSLLRIIATIPKAQDFIDNIQIVSTGSFAINSTFNISNGSNLTTTKTSDLMQLCLSNIQTTSPNEQVILYMMFPSADYTKDTWTISFEGSSWYSKSIPGKKMLPGKAYSISINYGETYTLNGVEYPMPDIIDLGLPSGTRWADRAIGRNDLYSSTETFFEYGSTTPVYLGTSESYIKSIWSNDCGSANDPAFVVLGEDWRLPTFDEAKELTMNCSVSSNNEYYKIKGPNGNILIIPLDEKLVSRGTLNTGIWSHYGDDTPVYMIGGYNNIDDEYGECTQNVLSITAILNYKSFWGDYCPMLGAHYSNDALPILPVHK